MDERSVAGPLNLNVPGGAGGEAPLPLRLLDAFCLYVRQEDDSEVLTGLEALQDGAHAYGCMHAWMVVLSLAPFVVLQVGAPTLLQQVKVHDSTKAVCERLKPDMTCI